MSRLTTAVRASAAAFISAIRAQAPGTPPPSVSPFDASQNSGYRSSVAGFPIDSFREITPLRRREIVRKSRSLRNNFPFLRALASTATELAIGWGLQPMPSSGNKDFDRRAAAYWKRWSSRKTMDVSGKHSHAQMQRLVCNEMQIDGELFQLKVADNFGRRQRQLFKTEQVGYGFGAYDYGQVPDPGLVDGLNWVDGIGLNSLMKPAAFRFLQRELPGTSPTSGVPQRFTTRSASAVNHIFEKERATQNRGLPWAYCGMNSFVDALDIQQLELVGHKLNGAIVGSIHTKDGSPTKAMQNIMAAAQLQAGQDVSTTVPDDGTRFIDLNGTQIPIFKTDENMTFNNQGRSLNPMEFLLIMLRGACIGYGLPFDIVWDWSGLGGASVRGASEMTNRFAQRIQMTMIEDMCQPDWEDVIGTAILASFYPLDYPLVEPLDPPPGVTGWNCVTWRGPKDITVDKGKDGKLFLELMRAGKMSDQEWWTLNGEDPETMPEICDDEVAAGLERWRARGLPEEHYWRRLFGPQAMQGSSSGSGHAEDPAEPPEPGDAKALIAQLKALLQQH